MKKWQKLALSTVTILSAAALLSACNAGKKKTDSSKGKGDVEISFSWWGNDDRHKVTQEMIDNFEKENPTIKVKGEPSGFGDLDQVFTTRYAGNTLADVTTVLYDWVPQFGQNEGFYDLSKIKTLDLSSYDKDFLKFGQVDGKQVAVPYGENVICMYVNKTAYEKNGIDVASLKTWDDYKEAAKKLPEGSFMIASPTWRFPVTVWLQQKTGKAEFDEKGDMNWSEKDYLEAMTWYKEMADARVFVSRKSYLENVGTEPVSLATNKKYLEGEYGGGIGWNAGIASDFIALEEAGQELVVVDYPIAEGATKVNLLSKPSLLFVVKKDEKNPEQVGTFLNDFLNGKKANEILGLSRGIPASTKAVEALEETGQLTGGMKTAYDYVKKADKISETPFYENGTLTTIYTAEMEAVELGKTDLKTAAKNVYNKTKEQAAKLAKDYKLK
ncbi:oligogalacturonide transport system substrate-binding protein [Pilibacter termitis]|uniref:Oligogalacturonide transport system substrate-binding protein n=1 Tax=Pilibacter termitis TaxID=263852 RepID=A0A1T4R2L3_9ENTE|nr:ABC transporter substrate-binding protein [Pilibacter termitis]SKA10189.1 oligogalacturonide transport system substrate-binding protein [Pilibacter termitis]